MIQSHRPIPRETDVPFHIAVEAEKIAEIILTEIGRIASAVRDAFPMFAIRTDAKNFGRRPVQIATGHVTSSRADERVRRPV